VVAVTVALLLAARIISPVVGSDLMMAGGFSFVALLMLRRLEQRHRVGPCAPRT
jgi:hypothetical protein